MEHGKPANISVLADAAIRTVLERLREPTSAMLAAATPGDELVAKGYWKDMLDAAVREVG